MLLSEAARVRCSKVSEVQSDGWGGELTGILEKSLLEAVPV